MWHRARIECGLDNQHRSPESFWVPSDEEKAELRPGDLVKLQWSVKRYAWAGERMWVEIAIRHGDQFIGRLRSLPELVHLDLGEAIRFRIDDIIDYDLSDEGGATA